MKIVCLGDSLTAGHGVRPEECWVSLVAGMTSHQWINAGICGDTSGGMLARLHWDVLSQKPDCAFLLGGVNDILMTGSWEMPRTNMLALVQQCVARNISPIVGIPLPLYPDSALPWPSFCPLAEAQDAVRAYAQWLRQFCKDSMLRTVDLGAALESYAEAHGWDAAFLEDGLHPSPAGHRVMAEAVAAQRFLQHRRG